MIESPSSLLSGLVNTPSSRPGSSSVHGSAALAGDSRIDSASRIGMFDHVGGVTEEIHRYLDTGHLSELELGFAVDQSLLYGPIVCE